MGTYFFGRNILFLSFLENPKKSLKIKAKPTKPWGKFTDPFDLVNYQQEDKTQPFLNVRGFLVLHEQDQKDL